MARFTLKLDAVPFALRSYDADRWVSAAIDADDPFIAHIPATAQAGHWYVRRIVAPAYYRAALTDAVGQSIGDAHFHDVLGGRTP